MNFWPATRQDKLACRSPGLIPGPSTPNLLRNSPNAERTAVVPGSFCAQKHHFRSHEVAAALSPGVRSTRGARLRSPGAKCFHRFAAPETHALRKPNELHAFNSWHPLNDLLCPRRSVSCCRTRAESRWLAQRKFRFFTTETTVTEQPLVIGFASGKSNDQRNHVDPSRYVAKNGTNRRTSLRHCRSKNATEH